MRKNILISGLTAAGKTTHSKILTAEFELKYFGASQILLETLGFDISKIEKGFWITPKGQEIAKEMTKYDVDNLLYQRYTSSEYSVFDCLSLPHIVNPQECLNILIDSSLESRIIKAAISENKTYINSDFKEKIVQKDQNSHLQLKKLLGKDYSDSNTEKYNIILDISSAITKIDRISSWKSINKAHRIINPIVGFFLTDDEYFLKILSSYYHLEKDVLIKKCYINGLNVINHIQRKG